MLCLFQKAQENNECTLNNWETKATPPTMWSFKQWYWKTTSNLNKKFKQNDFPHCVHCQDFFRKKKHWQHMFICKFKSHSQKLGKTCVQALCLFAVPPPPGVHEDLCKLIFAPVNSNTCNLEFGEHLYNRLGSCRQTWIEQKMRELGRLLVCSRRNTTIYWKPHAFEFEAVQGVKNVAGYNSETNKYELKIGQSLIKISLFVEKTTTLQPKKLVLLAEHRRQDGWHKMISAASLRTLMRRSGINLNCFHLRVIYRNFTYI